jgi:tRNA 2-selenouridine synthase
MDFKSIFINDLPLIDVRAPIEYEAGHFPTSVNLPLLKDEERHKIGIVYKRDGQERAIALGHELVSGAIKDERVRSWLQFLAQNPEALIYCFRGGLRSSISLDWIKGRGAKTEMIPGGFKALRRFLVETIQKESAHRSLLILSGKTGSRKTQYLYEQPLPFLDLEKYANHRGSSFGVKGIQPSQVTFENKIAVDFLKINSQKPILIEDESIMIGKCIVPQGLFLSMRNAQIVVLKKELAARVDHIIQEYVVKRTQTLCGDSHETHLEMSAGLQKISKKLGGARTLELKKELDQAFQSKEAEHAEPHRAWVQSLLIHYYDPHYAKGLQKRENQIIFEGNEEECTEFFLKTNAN